MHTNFVSKLSWVSTKSWECGYVGVCMLASVYVCVCRVCVCHVWLATTVSENFIPQRSLSGSWCAPTLSYSNLTKTLLAITSAWLSFTIQPVNTIIRKHPIWKYIYVVIISICSLILANSRVYLACVNDNAELLVWSAIFTSQITYTHNATLVRKWFISRHLESMYNYNNLWPTPIVQYT